MKCPLPRALPSDRDAARSYFVFNSAQAKDIASMDWMSKSDPMCVLYELDVNGEWVERARTEGITNDHNPTFRTKIEIDYHFEHKQTIRFDILDVDDPTSADLKKTELIGNVETTVGKVVGSRHGRFEAELTNANQGPGKKFGTICVTAETQKGRKDDKVRVVLEGISLAAKDGIFGKSDPYFVVKRFRKGTGKMHKSDLLTANSELMKNVYTCSPPEEVAFEHKSEYVSQNLNPTWQPAYLDFSELCGGDFDAAFKLEVWDYDAASSPDMIGERERESARARAKFCLHLLAKFRQAV